MAPFVGRQMELAVLRARLADALAGRPQIVQIQGPAGIGKTALVDHFLGEAGDGPQPVVIRASGEETEELLAYGWSSSCGDRWWGPPVRLVRTGSRPKTGSRSTPARPFMAHPANLH